MAPLRPNYDAEAGITQLPSTSTSTTPNRSFWDGVRDGIQDTRDILGDVKDVILEKLGCTRKKVIGVALVIGLLITMGTISELRASHVGDRLDLTTPVPTVSEPTDFPFVPL